MTTDQQQRNGRTRLARRQVERPKAVDAAGGRSPRAALRLAPSACPSGRRALRSLSVTIAAPCVAVAMLALPSWALTPVGTAIDNQAVASYADENDIIQPDVTTNLVRITVARVYGVDVSTANTPQNTLPGTLVYYPLVVTNTGNGPDEFPVTLSGTQAWTRQLYVDLNGNGFVDAGEATATGTGVLTAGAVKRFVVVLNVPASAVTGDTDTMTGTATSVGDPGATDSAVDVTNVFEGAVLTATKSGAPERVDPLATADAERTVTYTVNFSNPGSGPAVDVVVEDVLPQSPVGVVLAGEATANPPGTLEYFNRGTNAYEAFDAANLTSYSQVRLTLPSLGVNASGQLTFRVIVPQDATPGTMTNIATTQHQAAVDLGVAPIPTNAVTTTLFQTPAFTLDPPTDAGTTFPGATVTFTHTVTNTGNGPDVYNLALEGLPADWIGSILGPDSTTPLGDTTGDGIPDTGTLQPGESVTVTVRLRLPADQADDSVVPVTLAATDVNSGARATAVDTVTVQHEAPAEITLVADPPVIFGDGKEQAKLTATVLTAFGDPVPDGTQVVFTTPIGLFENGTQTFTTTTVNGLAITYLTADIVSDQPRVAEARVVAGTPITGIAEASVEITFTPSAITGLILDHSSGQPVPGLSISVVGLDTDFQGTFESRPDGTYLAAVPRLGRYRLQIPVRNTLGDIVIIEQEVEVTQYGVVFSPQSAIAGVIMARDTGDPLGNVTLRLTRVQPRAAPAGVAPSRQAAQVIQVQTDGRGGYVVNNLPLGDYDVEVIGVATPHYAHGRLSVGLDRAGQYVINANILLDPYGFVYDSVTNDRITGAEVRLLDGAGNLVATTNSLAQGHYVFPVLTNGSYRLLATAPGYQDYDSGPLNVTRQVANQNLPLVPLPQLTVTKTPDKARVPVGDTVTFTLTVQNTGGVPATGVVLTDTLPGGLLTQDGRNTQTWQLGTLAVGSAPVTRTLTTVATSTGLVPGTNVVTNRVAAVSAEDPTPTEVTADVEIIVPYLRVTKRALRSEVQTGDVVPFEITVENTSQNDDARNLQIIDILPSVLSYRVGTPRLDGQPTVEPAVAGRTYTWTPPNLTLVAGATVRLTFHTILGAAGEQGLITNVAQAMGTAPNGVQLTGNRAQVQIRRRERFFTDRGLILGRVFVDTNGNRLPDKGEPGVARVAVFTETGVRAITDEEGKYVIPEVLYGEHVVRLDVSTLPTGYRPVTIDHRNALNARSRFCQVQKGGLAKANFALVGAGSTTGSAAPGTPMLERVERTRR